MNQVEGSLGNNRSTSVYRFGTRRPVEGRFKYGPASRVNCWTRLADWGLDRLGGHRNREFRDELLRVNATA